MNVQTASASHVKWNGPRMDLPMKALIDRAEIDADIASLARRHGDNTLDFRKAAVEVFAEALAKGAALARAELESGGGGLACGAHLAYVEDEILRAIHDCVIRYTAHAEAKLCVVAVGGYGRGARCGNNLIQAASDHQCGAVRPEQRLQRWHQFRSVQRTHRVQDRQAVDELGRLTGHDGRRIE